MKKGVKKHKKQAKSSKTEAKKRSNVRHVLHNLYFSKPYKPSKAKAVPKPKPAPKQKSQPKPAPKQKKPGLFGLFHKKSEAKKQLPPVQEIKQQVPKPMPIEKPVFVPVADKNLEKRLEQVQQYFEKRLSSTETSLLLVKELFDELKRENESLRRERALMVDKLNTQSFDPNQATWQEPEDAEGAEKHPIGSFASNQNQGNNVKTSLDQLLEMIMEKGSVKISEASKKLKIKEKQIEEWAKMLEEHGLIEIHYPAVGKPVLKKKNT